MSLAGTNSLTGAAQDRAFLDWLDNWYAELKSLPLAEALRNPGQAAIFSADMVVGFCHKGSLASERVGSLVRPVVALFQRAYSLGVRNFVLAQDTHHESTPEFEAFPAHCLVGSEESETIPELKALPFASSYTIIRKNSLSAAINTELDDWLSEQRDLRDCIVVGDCTDLCTYQLAMHLRLRANALDQKDVRVIIPANCVDTYDLSLEVAQGIGAMPHPGTLIHKLFLYHLGLNGCQVVRELS